MSDDETDTDDDELVRSLKPVINTINQWKTDRPAQFESVAKKRKSGHVSNRAENGVSGDESTAALSDIGPETRRIRAAIRPSILHNQSALQIIKERTGLHVPHLMTSKGRDLFKESALTAFKQNDQDKILPFGRYATQRPNPTTAGYSEYSYTPDDHGRVEGLEYALINPRGAINELVDDFYYRHKNHLRDADHATLGYHLRMSTHGKTVWIPHVRVHPFLRGLGTAHMLLDRLIADKKKGIIDNIATERVLGKGWARVLIEKGFVPNNAIGISTPIDELADLGDDTKIPVMDYDTLFDGLGNLQRSMDWHHVGTENDKHKKFMEQYIKNRGELSLDIYM